MRRIVTGLAATILLALLLFGLPALLIAVGPIGLPHVEPTLTGFWHALLRPDDGTLFLTLVKVVGWVSWAILAVSVIAEVLARLRHVRVPRIPGLAIPQGVARGLVAAAVALLINAQGALAEPIDAGAQPLPATAPEAIPQHHLPNGARPEGVEHYTVTKGDILSQIALDHLGNAHRYPEIFKASRNIRQPGGAHLTNPDVIDIGWKLDIPTEESGSRREPAKEPTAGSQKEAGTPPAPPGLAPANPATPATGPQSSTAQPTAAATSTQPEAVDESSSAMLRPDWLLSGLAGAGAILAGSLWLTLRRRRTLQHHHRHPGLMTTPPPVETLPVEKTLRREGQPISDLLAFVDESLRRLAATILTTQDRLPDLVAIEVARSSLALHLADETTLPGPWKVGTSPSIWSITTADDLETMGPLEPDGPAPWPHLATVGADASGDWWLLNLEHLGLATIIGDTDFANDLARYLAAELATNPWSRDLEIDLVGVFHELTGLNPSRIHFHAEPRGVEDTVAAAVDIADRLNLTHSPDAPTARARQDGDDLWASRVLITNSRLGGNLDQLLELIDGMSNRTATAAVLIGSVTSDQRRVEIFAGSDGRVRIPTLGLDLIANGITIDEAHGAVQLLQAAEMLEGTPVPPFEGGGEPWKELCDQAGRLNLELTTPRQTDGAPEPSSSVLPEADAAIIEMSATTSEDLAVLAPTVPADTVQRIADIDPALDADLADWFSAGCERPRVAVLGDVRVRAGSNGDVTEANKRKPYYTELVAYLVTRTHGATTEEICKAFDTTPDRIRRDLAVVRKWLGTDPHGSRYLPEAARSQASAERGSNAYQLRNVLYDADLFRRLRLRGQTRGPDGLRDFMAALSLVGGSPYGDLRDRGGIWLSNHRDDQHLLVGIVDVAHLAVTMALQSGDLDIADRAARIAMKAASDEEIPKLDLAAVAGARGHLDVSAGVAREVWDQRDVDGPLELDPRTVHLLLSNGWTAPNARAS